MMRATPRRNLNQAEVNGNGPGARQKTDSAAPLTEGIRHSTRAPDGEHAEGWTVTQKTEPTKSNGAPT